MTPFVNDADFQLYVGDVRDCLRELPAASVHCVVTSPPFWGLRDYGTGRWDGGDPDCEHVAVNTERTPWANSVPGPAGATAKNAKGRNETKERGGVCGKCGATRVDQQLGLEPTPELFVAAMVDVFREVRRVLRDDGTLWLNLGDSYASTAPGTVVDAAKMTGKHVNQDAYRRADTPPGLKPKDLCGIPWRVAFAFQADGWYLRSDIVWSKPNPMPESVTDRPTKAHEYVFLLSKSPRYFFDQEAVREPVDWAYLQARTGGNAHGRAWPDEMGGKGTAASGRTGKSNHAGTNPAGRNVRSVWEIATQPYPEAHFATFPEALPERCIRAGTSERGCCPECGAPWEREVERELEATRGKVHANTRTDPMDSGSQHPWTGGVYGHYNVTTTGWLPSCTCLVPHSPDAQEYPFAPVPCTVLDPFMGSGTTALVARRLGRHSVGCELNQSYAELCARRTQQLAIPT